MNDIEYQRIARRILRGLIVESNAQSFQDLFWKIAVSKFDNFEKVKPQGNKGDKKNDGYLRGLGVFYQVYSPEIPQKNEQNAIKKIMKDFTGLYSFWNNIETVKEFNFVFNDKFTGSYPDLYTTIKDLEINHPNIKFNLFSADDLQRMFDSIPPKKQEDILHLNSNDTILSYEALNTVAEHLKSLVFLDGMENKLIAPDFEEKIKFNHLSPITAEMLKSNYENISEVEKYFANDDNKELKQELQEKYVHLYNGAVKIHGEPLTEEISENIFFDIIF